MWGGVIHTSCFGIFRHAAINCYWKIQVVRRRTYKFNSSGHEKDQLQANAVGLLLLLLGPG